MDDLSRPFDLLIIGTCLPNAIVAAAAAQRGLRVLHADANAFYGAADATLPLPHLHALLSGSGASPLAGSALTLRSALPPLPRRALPAAGRAARQVLLDARPRLLLAQGAMAALLVASDAARYLTYHRLGACSAAQRSAGAAAAAPPALLRVPASKGGVFLNPGLSLLEKRGVMRFLQAAMDGASLGSGSEGGAEADDAPAEPGAPAAVQWLNEAVLGSGRALLRPQNKSASALDEAAFAARPLHHLLSAGAGLSPRTAELLQHAVALEGSSAAAADAAAAAAAAAPLPGQQGMQRIRSYLTALARYGGTAFLAHEYGSGALCEAFSRLAAVHGAVYMLGSAPRAWEVAEGAAPAAAEGAPAPAPAVRVRLALAEGGRGGEEVVTVTAQRVLLAPGYGASLPPGLLAALPAAATAPACATVVCVCVVAEGGGADAPGSQHIVIPPSAARGAARAFSINLLEQGVEDRVAPPGLRVLYFYCAVPAAAAAAASEAVLQEANSGAWFSPAEEEVEAEVEAEGKAEVEGQMAQGGGGEEATAQPPAPSPAAPAAAAAAAAAPAHARRLLWQVCYSIAPAPPAAAAAAAAAAAPPPPAAASALPCIALTPLAEHLPPSAARPWLGCCVVNEDAVALAEAAYAQLFPGCGALFEDKAGASEGSSGEGAGAADAAAVAAVAAVAAAVVAVPEEGAGDAAAAGSEAPAEVPAAAPPAPRQLSDLEEALAMLQSEPLDL